MMMYADCKPNNYTRKQNIQRLKAANLHKANLLVKLSEDNQRLKKRLALYDKYLGDTMQKTENAELRALVKAAYDEGMSDGEYNCQGHDHEWEDSKAKKHLEAIER